MGIWEYQTFNVASAAEPEQVQGVRASSSLFTVLGVPPLMGRIFTEEEEAPGPSYWPVVLTLGIVGIAAGLIYNWEYGALLVALPLAAASGAAWGSKIQAEMQAAEAAAAVPAIIGPDGSRSLPVPTNVLTAQAAGGVSAAALLERP